MASKKHTKVTDHGSTSTVYDADLANVTLSVDGLANVQFVDGPGWKLALTVLTGGQLNQLNAILSDLRAAAVLALEDQDP
jgi:hypothetical protein